MPVKKEYCLLPLMLAAELWRLLCLKTPEAAYI